MTTYSIVTKRRRAPRAGRFAGDSGPPHSGPCMADCAGSPLKQIAIVSLHQNLLNYTDMLSALQCSFRIVRDVDGLSPVCDGLLLSGGGDCCPALYGQKNKGSRNLCLEEDLLLLSALDFYLHAGHPILGIGKGMHIINIAFGGSLHQHIGNYPHDAIRLSFPNTGIFKHEFIERYHHTTFTEGSILEALYGSSVLVNSSHHQAIDRLGNELEIIQYAYDDCPEAISHRTLPVIGLQWHPEQCRNCKAFSCPAKKDCPSALADGSLIFKLFLALV